jgi:hypothetical protein
MKNEDCKSEKVEGEEAKREVVMTIDCLCLKGYSHIWVNGASAASRSIPGASRVISSDNLPSSPAVNDVVILTADVYKEDGSTLRFTAGTVVTYTGSSWIEYTGEIVTAA